MKKALILILPVLFSSCYKTLEIDGFSTGKWKSFRQECTEYRMESVSLITDQKEFLLETTQNEIESLLGAPEEHELYERNQKFFHYRLTPPDSCGAVSNTVSILSVRFNAIGRASDIQVILRDIDQ